MHWAGGVSQLALGRGMGARLGGVCLGDGGLSAQGVWGMADTAQPNTMGYGQQVGGTHPTEMHSCSHKRNLA